jgi:hypothetical protein
VCDENAIDIVTCDMLRQDSDMNDKSNYSVITMMPSQIYVISKAKFLTFVTDRALKTYQSTMLTMVPDWNLRKQYVQNAQWKVFKDRHVK